MFYTLFYTMFSTMSYTMFYTMFYTMCVFFLPCFFIPCFKQYFIPCYTILYHVIQCYTMLYHVIPLYVNLSRGKHVGKKKRHQTKSPRNSPVTQILQATVFTSSLGHGFYMWIYQRSTCPVIPLLVGGFKHFLFSIIYGIIFPID